MHRLIYHIKEKFQSKFATLFKVLTLAAPRVQEKREERKKKGDTIFFNNRTHSIVTDHRKNHYSSRMIGPSLLEPSVGALEQF